MTQTVTVDDGRAYVFVTVEHANGGSSAFMPRAQPAASRRSASTPGVHRCFAIAPGVARGLRSNYMSGDFQDEIECLGIEASPSFVREPQGNGMAGE
jgi:putative transposase